MEEKPVSPKAPPPPIKLAVPKPGSAPAETPAAPAVPPKPGASPALPPRPAGAPEFDKKKLFKVGGIGLAVVLLLWGVVKIVQHFKSSGEEEGPKTGGVVAVNVMEVKPDHFQDTLTAVGTIAGGSEIPLRFQVEGTVDHFEFREGDKVRKGALIARLSQRDAYLKLKQNEMECDRYRKLYAIGGCTRAQMEEICLKSDLARSDMEKTALKAPRDGILGDKDAEVGEFVTPSKKIGTLVNIESVLVRLGVIEKDIDKIFPGQKVVLTVDSYPNVEFTGRVETISPIGDGHSFTIEARLDNEGGLLLPGMFARTRITIFEEDNAIAVPNDALEKTQGGSRVYVVTKENKAQAREVEIGYVAAQFSQITRGLEPGEQVITQKPQDLKDGAAVKVIEVNK